MIMHSERPRSRLVLFISLLAVIGLGLASRKIPDLFPAFLDKYPGDALWAMMVLLALALIAPMMPPMRLGLWALGISYLDEVSQLYHAPWIDSVRRTTPGHLLLGSTFSWFDMASYTVGIGLGVLLDLWLARRTSPSPITFPMFRSGARKALLGAAGAFGFGIGGVLLTGECLSHSVHGAAGAAPNALSAEAVTFPAPPNGTVAGWLSQGNKRKGAILLLHGVRSSRRQMLKRALFLHHQGYTVLLIDLPAHGESSGNRITFGARERLGVTAAVEFLRHRCPQEPVAAIGVSLGAASLVLADITPHLDAVILESMFPTIEEAVKDRLVAHLGYPGAALAPVLLTQLPMRLGISAQDLHPIDHVGNLGAPVFIISGASDQHTTAGETERIFNACPEPKQLWLVPNAAHVDLQAFAPDEYQERVLAFLHRYLRPSYSP